MSKYRTCVGCLFEGKPCGERDKMRAKVAGMGITSMKWKCEWRRPSFNPGDLVMVQIVIEWGAGEFDDETVTADFPGVFVMNSGLKMVVFIEPGTRDKTGVQQFEPKNGGDGFCKIPRAYVRHRAGVPEHVCSGCLRLVRLNGHEQTCRASRPSTNTGRAG